MLSIYEGFDSLRAKTGNSACPELSQSLNRAGDIRDYPNMQDLSFTLKPLFFIYQESKKLRHSHSKNKNIQIKEARKKLLWASSCDELFPPYILRFSARIFLQTRQEPNSAEQNLKIQSKQTKAAQSF